MQVNRRVGQRIAHPLFPGHEQDRPERGGDADGVSGDRGGHKLHRVVNRQSGIDLAARAVDVHVDLLLG